METINGGYYKMARKEKDSEVASAPPHVREIWHYLIREATHKENGRFKSGQCMKSLGEIAEDLKWFVGWRTERYTKNQCEFALRWLMKQSMITKKKTTRGLIITICNYDRYQDAKNYESNKRDDTHTTRSKQSSDTINKNVKEEEKEEIGNSKFEFATIDIWKDFLMRFNQTSKRNFIGSNKIRRQLNARLREGRTVDQIIEALKTARRDDFHKGNNFQYLTPEFILRSDKLDMFLNSKQPKRNLNR